MPIPTTDRVRSWHPEEIVNKLLIGDERVYAFESPDWRIVVLDQAPMAVIGIVVSALALTVAATSLAVLVFVVLAVALLWRALESWYTRYVLTDFRVLRISGILDRNVEFIPWRKVTDVSLQRSAWQRVVGASTIRIESANEASQFRAMGDVREPIVFFHTLQEVMAAYSGTVEVENLGSVDIPRHGSGRFVQPVRDEDWD